MAFNHLPSSDSRIIWKLCFGAKLHST